MLKIMTNDLELPVTDLPIACSLTVNERVERGDEVGDLFKGVQQVRELADGYAYRFQGNEEYAARLVKFIVGERSCCPFFTFELGFEPNQGPIWLYIRGPEGVKEFMKEWAAV
jgi:hypothetical protein